MDITLFFVLPLIGGFAFVTGFLLLSYKTGRQEAQRLYYRAALYGVILAIGAAILHQTANAVLMPLSEKDHSAASLPMSAAALSVRLDLANICLCAFVLGAGMEPDPAPDRSHLAEGRAAEVEKVLLGGTQSSRDYRSDR